MKRVVVTGGQGFLGQYCLPILLEKGYEVHAVTSKSSLLQQNNIHWHTVDLLNTADAKKLMDEVKPSHLLHLAWYTAHGKFWTAPENIPWLQSSLDLVEQFVANGGKRVVVAGTCAQYDWRFGYCSEKLTPSVSTSLYGTSKNALESMTQGYCKPLNVKSASGRIFFLYGPHEYPNRLVPSVIRSLLADTACKTTEGNQIRDFLYVKDAADAFATLLDSDIEGAVNIGSGKPVVLKDLITQIANQLGKPELVELGALPSGENDPPIILADAGRLCDELGWKPKTDLASGIEQTIAWWKEQF